MMTPEWMAAYVARKTDEFLADMEARGIVVESRDDVRLAASTLVAQVMYDMNIHLSHTTEDEKRRWAAGS